ncbi:hypothetical protein SAY87_014574 [Trapa incisa]|uniref:CRM domain-containing protein n=1 Tax=Trapa incisa TaxID=236973 RepID=A0AAN7GNH4_9MYRT|nr:hypothetical protein SAY87_014574 [Trapa incisa]
MLLSRLPRRKPTILRSPFTLFPRYLCSTSDASRLRTRYDFRPPPSLLPQDPENCGLKPSSSSRKTKPQYRPPSSLDKKSIKTVKSDLPFDFRFSYTESSQDVRPIGLREPKYSPFGPGRLDRQWTGVCAPAVDPRARSVEALEEGEDDTKLEEKRKKMREMIQGEPLSPAERKYLVQSCQRKKTNRQVNLGRDGLTHNMLNDIFNHWKHAEAVRIKCLGVPTVDMKNVCHQLEDKTFGQIIHRHCGVVILYRGRNYNHKKRPVIPLMLWKPHEPIYPRLIKTTIDGLSIIETKEMRKRGLSVPPITKLGKSSSLSFYYS